MTKPAAAIPDLSPLLERRAELVRFVAARLGGNLADAEDVVQHGLVKALAAAPTLRANERLLPWFYRLLRHALIDFVRHRQSSNAREQRWVDDTQDLTAAATPAVEAQLCQCLAPLIATLPDTQAQLVRQVDLAGAPVQAAASSLGITSNAASVALHRARTALRAKLRTFCGDCATGACLNCDCDPKDPSVNAQPKRL